MNTPEGVDLRKLNPEAEYTLRQLANVFPYSEQALRQEIQKGRLRARRRGKFLIVLGRDAAIWWKSE